MINKVYNSMIFAKCLYLILATGYNCFWSLLSLWSLGKKLQNTLLQQLISMLVMSNAWCFTPNNLIQALLLSLEDPDIKQEPKNSLFCFFQSIQRKPKIVWELDLNTIVLIFNTIILKIWRFFRFILKYRDCSIIG